MRVTRRKAKPGEVILFYGRLPGDNPDHIGMWGGEGATKRHSNMIMSNFSGLQVELDPNRPQGWKFGKSFLKALDEAGFDTTTIEFSIRVKRVMQEDQEAPRG